MPLGRAPGTDQLTLRALRRSPEAADNFPQDVLEVQAFLAPAGPNQRIQAVPAAGTNVPLWILGSSHFGAMLAAELGKAGHRVRLFERRLDPRRADAESGRSINLAISVRGLHALRAAGVEEAVLAEAIRMPEQRLAAPRDRERPPTHTRPEVPQMPAQSHVTSSATQGAWTPSAWPSTGPKGPINGYNHGKGIPGQVHKEHTCYVPELISAHFLTSDNYNDKEKKGTDGRNGYDAKLTSVSSTKSAIRVADKSVKRK